MKAVLGAILLVLLPGLALAQGVRLKDLAMLDVTEN